MTTLAHDKRLHLLAGINVAQLTILASVFFGLFDTTEFAMMLFFGSGWAAIAGLVKEAWDAANPETHTVDPYDAFTTMCGGPIAAVAQYLAFKVLA